MLALLMLEGASAPHPTKWSPTIFPAISPSPLSLSCPQRLVLTFVALMASHMVPHPSSHAALSLPCPLTIARSPPEWLRLITSGGLRDVTWSCTCNLRHGVQLFRSCMFRSTAINGLRFGCNKPSHPSNRVRWASRRGSQGVCFTLAANASLPPWIFPGAVHICMCMYYHDVCNQTQRA